ncbi:hypothetical protein XENORESO_020867 [Xenotaenia resolanae]|uniref:Uncharacterized protein n=1 Tax=Xenotaenia resolanae TaxID=208358 RepID=A0ABV0VV39_9TELE
MCPQSTKDVLERMLHSSDFHGLCPSGIQKTTPLVQEVSRAPATAEPSLSSGCSRQLAHQAVVDPCPPFSKSNRRDSLHSINPAFRLASPSPTLSRSMPVLGNGRAIGFMPQH